MSIQLGYERSKGDFFLGGSYEHRRILGTESKILKVAIFGGSGTELTGPEDKTNYSNLIVFQEVDFDAVRAIRRGFLWKWVSGGAGHWHGYQGHDIDTYFPHSLAGTFGGIVNIPSKVILTFGSQDVFTIGEAIHWENTVDQRELLTVQMRKQFGILPELDRSKLSANEHQLIETALFSVVSGYRSSPPDSIIDRCREAARVLLRIKTGQEKKDLGELVKLLIKSNRGDESVASRVGDILARLHSRTKSSERERRGLNAPTEYQAETAVYLLGSLIYELELAVN